MALTVMQSMNQSFLAQLLPKAEKTETFGDKSATVTNIAKSITDSFQRQLNPLPISAQRVYMYSAGSSAREIKPMSQQPEGQSGGMFLPAQPLDAAFSRSSASVDVSFGVGAVTGGGPEPAEGSQQAVNRQQAQEIKAQLKVDGDVDWGVDSLGEDLAVFGLDFTAMNRDPQELMEEIHAKAQEMLVEIDKNAGTDPDYDAKRRVVSGATARLLHGLDSAGSQTSLATAEKVNRSSGSVSVGGVTIDAGAVVSVGTVVVDPVVLDLEGDGLDLRGADEGVEFDMDGDGRKSRMGFIQGDDAFLFHDSQGDGVVHDGRQLFGNTDGHANGFEKLKEFDDNQDGVIDQKDALFDTLRVWADANGDGVSTADETKSLAEAGVSSINVGYENVREDDGTGNVIGQTGDFTREDGSEGLAADVWFM